MKWGEHTHKCLVHIKFPAHLHGSVFIVCACVQHTTWCTVHTSWKKIQHIPVTTRCALTTVQKVVSAHFMLQVCTNHQVDSVCSTLTVQVCFQHHI